MRSVQPCDMKKRDIYWRRYKIKETLYIGQMMPQSSFKEGTLGPHTVLTASLPPFETLWILYWNRHQLSCHIFLTLIHGLKSLPFQRWFYFWEKPEVTGHQMWFTGSSLNQLLAAAAWCSFCSGNRSCRMNFAITFHAKILCQNLGCSNFWNPQISF